MKKNLLITMAILTVVTGSSIVYANPDAATTAAGTAAVVSTLVANDAMKASTEPTPTNLVSGKTPRYDETIYNYYADITGYKENSLWGFKDPAGNILVKPTYKNIEAFNEELIKVQANNGKYGLINLKGKAVDHILLNIDAQGMTQCSLFWAEIARGAIFRVSVISSFT